MRRALALAWDALCLAGGVKAAAGFAAVALDGRILLRVNGEGVPLVVQAILSLVMVATAPGVWGRGPVRRAYAAIWAVGAGEMASPAIVAAGWHRASMAACLVVLVPAALAIPLVMLRKRPAPEKATARAGLFVAAGAILAAAVLVLAHPVPTPVTPLALAGFTAAILAGSLGSVLALHRRRV